VRSAEYEHLVSEICRTMCVTSPSINDLEVAWGAKNRLLGASGYKHQIDVSLEGHGRTFVFECKHWKRKIGLEEVLVLASRLADLQAARPESHISAAMVSLQQATRGAQQLARHFGITLDVGTSPSEYGLRIGNVVGQALSDGFSLGDRVIHEVRRNGVLIDW